MTTEQHPRPRAVASVAESHHHCFEIAWTGRDKEAEPSGVVRAFREHGGVRLSLNGGHSKIVPVPIVKTIVSVLRKGVLKLSLAWKDEEWVEHHFAMERDEPDAILKLGRTETMVPRLYLEAVAALLEACCQDTPPPRPPKRARRRRRRLSPSTSRACSTGRTR